jgi:hypothetical protein
MALVVPPQGLITDQATLLLPNANETMTAYLARAWTAFPAELADSEYWWAVAFSMWLGANAGQQLTGRTRVPTEVGQAYGIEVVALEPPVDGAGMARLADLYRPVAARALLVFASTGTSVEGALKAYPLIDPTSRAAQRSAKAVVAGLRGRLNIDNLNTWYVGMLWLLRDLASPVVRNAVNRLQGKGLARFQAVVRLHEVAGDVLYRETLQLFPSEVLAYRAAAEWIEGHAAEARWAAWISLPSVVASTSYRRLGSFAVLALGMRGLEGAVMREADLTEAAARVLRTIRERLISAPADANQDLDWDALLRATRAARTTLADVTADRVLA